MIYTYFDTLLSPLMSDDIEQRAITDVDSMGYTNTEATAYLYQQLVMFKAYSILSMECSTSDNDIFTQKYKMYRKEFDAIAKQFKDTMTAQTSTVTGSSARSIGWGRG